MNLIEFMIIITYILNSSMHFRRINPMTELLKSATLEATKMVYNAVTVGANNKTEEKSIAKEVEK